MSVDIRCRQALREHENLHMVEELRNLLGRCLIALVLRGHPDLCSLLDDLLADGVHAGIKTFHSAGTGGPGLGLLAQLGEQLVESLHGTTLPFIVG